MLLNVRLGPEEERVLRGLRRAGVNVSALVRKAIRDTDTALLSKRTRSPGDAVREILTELPVSKPRELKRPMLNDRRALKAYLRERIRRP